MLLYDTQARKKRTFVPADLNRVTMYACGPTVYDTPHIGNARPAVVFDVLFRILRRQYGQASVIYARNYTDVDDKIIDRARHLGIEIDQLTERTILDYEAATGALNVLDPSLKPRATHSIDAMQAMIGVLIEKAHAYVAQGHVLFSVDSNPEPGKLSGMPIDQLREGARVEVAPYKRDPADFVLWKPSDPDQPGWESPWGRGRPGWHIECSSMIATHLGKTIDIHAGGADLVFPHHENEVAQSQCAHGAPLASYWVHNGMITVNGKKMSKSLGNFVTVPQALERAPGEALRYLLMTAHYRQPLDFTWERLSDAKSVMDRLYRALQRVWELPAAEAERGLVLRRLEDDLNTPEAFAAMHAIADDILAGRGDMAKLKSELTGGGALLGLLQTTPEAWFQGDADTEVTSLIEARHAARKAKDWARSDAIRNQLTAMGIVLEDGPSGTTWRRG